MATLPSDWNLSTEQFMAEMARLGIANGGQIRSQVAGDPVAAFTLADGRTWNPSGGGAGIRYVDDAQRYADYLRTNKLSMSGRQRSGGGDNPFYKPPLEQAEWAAKHGGEEPYWEVKGDMSALFGQDDTDQHGIFKYRDNGQGKMELLNPPKFYEQTQGPSTGLKVALALVGGLAGASALGFLGGGSGGAAAVGGGWAAPAATGAAAATPASGVAGMIGMDAGLGATALNSGVLNAGVNLASGGDLKSALKAGVTGAATAGMGGWASQQIAALLPAGTSPAISKALGTVAARTVSGGVSAAINGGDIGDGLINGARSGVAGAAGNYLGNMAGNATGSTTVGGAVSGGVSAAINGKDIKSGLISGAIDGFTGMPGAGAVYNAIANPGSAPAPGTVVDTYSPPAAPVTQAPDAPVVKPFSVPNIDLWRNIDNQGWATARANYQASKGQAS